MITAMLDFLITAYGAENSMLLKGLMSYIKKGEMDQALILAVRHVLPV